MGLDVDRLAYMNAPVFNPKVDAIKEEDCEVLDEVIPYEISHETRRIKSIKVYGKVEVNQALVIITHQTSRSGSHKIERTIRVV